MHIKQLQFLSALAREKHFGRAAERCFVSQPTLSARIRQLEEELGAPLVDRSQHTFHGLTAEGERALGWARKILADCEAMRTDVGGMTGELEATIAVGVIPSALPYSPALTGSFSVLYPKVSINVLTQSSQTIQRGLDNYEIEAGVSYSANEPLKNVHVTPLYGETYQLILSSDTANEHGLSEGAQLCWSDAASLPLILLTPDMQFRRIVDAAFASVDVHPQPALQTNSITSACAHVQKSKLSSVLPSQLVADLGMDNHLVAFDLVDPVVTHQIGLVTPDREPVAPITLALRAVGAELTRV